MSSIDPRIAALKDEVASWRRDIHAHPEILYEVHRTAALVAEKLKSFGVDEVVTGIGKTGVVGVIKGRKTASGKVVALRADMDALPMSEQTNLPYASKVANMMHACGHDGHTAMLLGAAKHLAADRGFDGTVVVVFQPAEEGGAGGKAMVDDGLVSRFGIQEFYGLHCVPGVPVGHFMTRPGPLMAATANFVITIEGKGAHGAQPHQGIDPVLIGSHMVTALQSIASRNTDPLKSVVVSVTTFNAGDAFNVIPQTAVLRGTVRFLEKAVGQVTEERFRAIVANTAKAFGAEARLDFTYGYPATVNHQAETEFAVAAAATVAGAGGVIANAPPVMGGEDFSYMLEAKPGAFLFIGNGDTAPLHNPAFDFNDEAIPAGISYWTAVAQRAMPLR
ncbi:MAG TPA: M20 aminoacylase family protein [Beijerinckiaceae bacterium]|nr:M20 aminoacylase family protein [Beijerinckiaceae bacterium]